MSRAALWRQEANVKQRERHANETFENALQEGRSRAQKGLIPMIKDDRTFNLNPMLLQNISQSPYFIKICSKIKDWTSLVDEIYYEVKHAEPWTQGHAKTPSTAFCLLLRLLCLRCTEKQMKLMLDHVDSPYIRVIGFLYLRFAADPAILWEWCQPYVYDEEMVKIDMNVKKPEITMGEFVRGLLTDLEYHRTRLPRLPVAIERDIKIKLLQEEQIEERALRNLKDAEKMKYFERVGSKVRAMYGDEEHPVTWYDAVVDRVIRTDDVSGVELFRPKFVVTFPEYGNTETVSVGEMDMPGAGVDQHQQHHSHSRSSRPPPSSHRDTGRRERERDMGRGYDHDHDRHRRDYDRHGGGRGYEERERGYNNRHHHDREPSRGRDYSHAYRDRDRDRDRDHHHRHSSRGYDDGRGGSRNYDRDDYRRRDRERSRSRDRDYDRAALPSESHLMQEVLRRDREKSTTSGGKSYASAPPASLRVAFGAGSGSGSSNHSGHSHPRDESKSSSRYEKKSSIPTDDREFEEEEKDKNQQPVKKTPEQLVAISEKKRKLLAKYG